MKQTNFVDVLELLVTLTADGRVNWLQLTDDDGYAVKYSSGTVQVREVQAAPGAGGFGGTVEVGVVRHVGRGGGFGGGGGTAPASRRL